MRCRNMIFSRIKRKIISFFRDSFFAESILFWFSLCKHNASVKTTACREKMEYTLLRENHVIEKGMSMRNPKIGFGQKKVLDLCKKLLKYKKIYSSENPKFLDYPVSTIKRYIEYTKATGTAIPEIESVWIKLSDDGHYEKIQSGIETVSKNDITKDFSSFADFVKARHSIRYFSRVIPDQNIIDEALKIAQQTPSACNRQGWKVHVFKKDACKKILEWQGGARGFEEEPTVVFLVTANLRAFLHYEPFQAYVDGGMYAMSLIYALHSVGLGTIPLSCGFHHSKLKSLHNLFDIPQNEVPIEIIACGTLEDKFNIAVSKRKSITETTVMH